MENITIKKYISVSYLNIILLVAVVTILAIDAYQVIKTELHQNPVTHFTE